MKHTLYSILGALICIVMFSACDPSEFLDDILGEATFTIVDCPTEDSPYNIGDTIKFKSSIVDETDLISADSINNIFLSANINLSQANIITNPYCGFQLKDTIAKDYPITLSLAIEDFANLKPDSLLTTIGTDNIFIISISDTSWCIGYDGTISLDSYPEYGHLAEGVLDSVKAYYVTNHKIDYITDIVNRVANLDPDALLLIQTLTFDDIFKTVIFNGNFASRRANIANLIESLINGENQ